MADKSKLAHNKLTVSDSATYIAGSFCSIKSIIRHTAFKGTITGLRGDEDSG